MKMKRIFAILMFLSTSNLFAQKRPVKTSNTDSVQNYTQAIKTILPSVVLVRTLVPHSEPDPHMDIVRSGTGIIVSEDGFILTNAHVVVDEQMKKSDYVEALVNQKKFLAAKIVGVDAEKDLALIKIDYLPSLGRLIRAKFHNGSPILGQNVLKAGFPAAVFSKNPTIAHGIITNTQAFIANISTPHGVTDAHLSSGDSGGPLCGLDGQVVGIDTRTKEGIGFFIPSQVVLNILPRLKKGDVRTGWLGINPSNCVDLSATAKDGQLKDRAEWHLKRKGKFLPALNSGIVIMDVVRPDIGDARLLQVGDTVIRMNRKIPSGSSELIRLIAETEPGSEIMLEIVRDNKRMLIRLRVGEFDWVANARPNPALNIQ